jgi:DUF4097 and DUF4098 domain-containing protein YvlB
MRALILRSSLLLLVATTASAQRDTAFTWSKRLPDGARLTIKNMNGPIDVRAASGDRVEVRATVRAESRGNVRDVTFDVRERSADDVEICTVYRGNSDCDPDRGSNNIRVTVRFIVEIPKSMRLRAATGNGEISITQTVADVDAASGNGEITIKESLGRVTASTGNGDVTISAARGQVKASSGNGRIFASTTIGPVEASTGNGDIDVKMGKLPADQGSMTFTTGSGSVRLALPPDFYGEIDANTGNGSISSDFEIRVQGRLSPTRMRGTICPTTTSTCPSGGPIIKLRSGNGNLTLRKS